MRVPDAVRRSLRRSAEPGPIVPREWAPSLAAHRFALHCIRGTRRPILLFTEASAGLCFPCRGAAMTTSEATTETNSTANRTGVYLAVLQLVFTLGWTTYVIYLPKLCADVGIALRATPTVRC